MTAKERAALVERLRRNEQALCKEVGVEWHTDYGDAANALEADGAVIADLLRIMSLVADHHSAQLFGGGESSADHEHRMYTHKLYREAFARASQ